MRPELVVHVLAELVAKELPYASIAFFQVVHPGLLRDFTLDFVDFLLVYFEYLLARFLSKNRYSPYANSFP